MRLTDWHAFVYRMRHSKFIFWPWKLSALKLLIENKKFQDDFGRFGHQLTVLGDVNNPRCELFRAKEGAVASEELPLCGDCLQLSS